MAQALGITRVRVNEIVHGKRAVSPDTALRLARYFSTSVDFWLDLQMDVILWDTLQAHQQEYEKIEPLPQPKVKSVDL